jgi:hypothetical protein
MSREIPRVRMETESAEWGGWRAWALGMLSAFGGISSALHRIADALEKGERDG